MKPSLPTLPKLPRHRPRSKVNTTRRASSNLYHSPGGTGRYPIKEGSWGGQVWYPVDPTVNPETAVGGVCAWCGQGTRAIDLQLRRTKADGDIWVCKECTQQ